jgi:integrase
VKRGLVSRNVALVAHPPKLKSIPKVEPQAWNGQQLQEFLRAATGHRLFPAFWLLTATGMRRSELLGLRWDDIDLKKARVSFNRGLVAVGYELHESRGKIPNETGHRPRADHHQGVDRLAGPAERRTGSGRSRIRGLVFTNSGGKPVHPHSISQTFARIAAKAGVPRIRLHDVRHTHGTLLIKAGVPVKVVSERLGHGNPAFTIDTYQHVLPGMQAEAAHTFEKLIKEQPPKTAGRRTA